MYMESERDRERYKAGERKRGREGERARGRQREREREHERLSKRNGMNPYTPYTKNFCYNQAPASTALPAKTQKRYLQ